MTRFAKFNEERTFGVELEFLDRDVSRSAIAMALQDEGIKAYNESYNHHTVDYWKVITDSSCGNEIVSPVLQGREGLEELRKVCMVLNRLGCKVNKECGLHIHHHAADLNTKNFQNLFCLYSKYEKLIDRLHPRNRRDDNNYYCSPLNKNDAFYGTYEDLALRIKSCKTVRDLQNLFSTRYLKLNIQSFSKYGTLEFRQHAGTLDYEQIQNWILFTQLMVERSKFSMITKVEREYDHLGCLYNMLGISRTITCTSEMFQMGKYYRAREKNLRTSRG